MFILEGSAGQGEDHLHGPTEDDAGRWAYFFWAPSSGFCGSYTGMRFSVCIYIYGYCLAFGRLNTRDFQ